MFRVIYLNKSEHKQNNADGLVSKTGLDNLIYRGCSLEMFYACKKNSLTEVRTPGLQGVSMPSLINNDFTFLSLTISFILSTNLISELEGLRSLKNEELKREQVKRNQRTV